MHYHADCGHIIEESPNSSFISETEWRDYQYMYLTNCPICGSKYPYVKALDNSVMPKTENLIYRLLQSGYQVHIPTHKSPTKSIRLENVSEDELGIGIKHEIVKDVDEYDTDVLLRIEPK